MYVLINCKRKSLKAVVVDTYWIGTMLKLYVFISQKKSYMYSCMYICIYACLHLTFVFDSFWLIYIPLGPAISSSSSSVVLMCWTIGGAAPAGRVISYPDHTEPDKRVIYVTQLSIKPVAGERGIRQDRTMVLPLLFSWNCSLIRCTHHVGEPWSITSGDHEDTFHVPSKSCFHICPCPHRHTRYIPGAYFFVCLMCRVQTCSSSPHFPGNVP